MVDKVTINFKAVGGAPSIPKGMKVQCNTDDRFERILRYLEGRLKPSLGSVPIFLYVKESFMPALEEEVGALVEAYGIPMAHGSGKELVVQYSTKPNWGPHYIREACGGSGSGSGGAAAGP